LARDGRETAPEIIPGSLGQFQAPGGKVQCAALGLPSLVRRDLLSSAAMLLVSASAGAGE